MSTEPIRRGFDARETRRRLESLERGPWVAKGSAARKHLRPGAQMSKLARSAALITVGTLNKLRPGGGPSERSLGRLFAPHWTREVTDDDAMIFRDSLDEALTLLQLYELAIQTDYLPLDAVREPARRGLLALLWSPAARRFVSDYQYLGVEFLATRVGIDLGLEKRIVPATTPHADIRFAAFLQLLEIWTCDADLDAWLGLLDGYMVADPDDPDYDERAAYHDFLTTGTLPCDALLLDVARFLRFNRGLHLFIFQMADFFRLLTQPELAHYSAFFSYWLSLFFGEDLGKSGYFDSDDLEDWSEAADAEMLTVDGQTLMGISPGIPGTLPRHARLVKVYRRNLSRNLRLLSKAWRLGRALLRAR